MILHSHNSSHQKILFLILTAVLGFMILQPYLDFQVQLTTGDNGRDLYAFEQTLKGKLPYQDYWWVYGPLMPYYYSQFFLIFGTTIKSILLGKFLLVFLAGLLIYLILSVITSPIFALIGALWFWGFRPDFSYTYNHIGGVALLLLNTYYIFRYLCTPKRRYIYLGLLNSLALALIKLNLGMANFIALMLSITLIEQKQDQIQFKTKPTFWIASVFSFGFFVFSTYWVFLHNLPLYAIRQCLPYFAEDRPIHTPFLETMGSFFWANIKNVLSSPANTILGIIILLSVGKTLHLLFNPRTDQTLKQKTGLSIAIILLLLAVNLHEFLLSGVAYRLYWVNGFQVILIFIVFNTAIGKIKKEIKFLLYATFITVVAFQVTSHHQMINRFKVPGQYLSHPKAQVYVANPANWLKVLEDTTSFLNKNLKAGTTFFALPYDPLYYYLTDKESPTRQLIFFDHININSIQEEKIIGEIEQHQLEFVLLSSRVDSTTPGLGTFGETYSPSLHRYIHNNFEMVAGFGDWRKSNDVVNDHAVRIYRRVKQ